MGWLCCQEVLSSTAGCPAPASRRSWTAVPRGKHICLQICAVEVSTWAVGVPWQSHRLSHWNAGKDNVIWKAELPGSPVRKAPCLGPLQEDPAGLSATEHFWVSKMLQGAQLSICAQEGLFFHWSCRLPFLVIFFFGLWSCPKFIGCGLKS